MTYSFHTPDKLCFILDLMNGGDLHYHLSQHGVFNEQEMRFYAAEVILGAYDSVLASTRRHFNIFIHFAFVIRTGTYAQTIYRIQGLKTGEYIIRRARTHPNFRFGFGV